MQCLSSGVTEGLRVVRPHHPGKKPAQIKATFLMKVICIYIKNLKESKHEIFPEAVLRRCAVKKVFLRVPQNTKENTCARLSFLIKVAGLRPATLL